MNFVSKNKWPLRFSTSLAIGILVSACIYCAQTNLEAAACPKECCAPAKACGTLLSFCSPEQSGKSCNGCDGTTNVRLCAKCVQDRKCTAKTGAATVCGNKFTGTCVRHSVYGYYYCKKTAAGGSHSCTVSGECTGDKACGGGG
ncbi:hypothetical protein Enr17x_27700 [Gimesia fumaroli]|uniref:Uncharacterized protein n=1 Tax=Gimesia fumaroli TaxID=2527976 RepID=A0A518ICA3_9PLAN|nr:hypothetical protein Enr17x_27700 [Gimesia fumaroli]